MGRTRHYQLQPAVPEAARPRPARLHTMSFEEYCSNLYDPRLPAKQKVVAVLRHADDVDPDPAPYYLCRIVCAPWQLPEDCLVAGNEYERGWYVCRIQWYSHKHSDSNGDRVFELLTNPRDGEIHSCSTFIRMLVKFKQVSHGKYVLSWEMGQRLRRYHIMINLQVEMI